MKISVITIARNSAATIAHTIESFLVQTHQDAELIIMDGASTDETVAIAERYKDARIRIYSEPDEGLYDAMNKGLDLFRGDAVGFLNSDDTYHDHTALARIAEALDSHDVVYGNLDFVEDHTKKTVVRRWRGSQHSPGAFRSGWMPAHPTFYIRRAIVERSGRFDPTLRVAADYDFMLRAMEGGSVNSVFLDRVLVDMMVGGNSTCSWVAYLKGNIESLRSRRKWLGTSTVDIALFAKPMRKFGQICRPMTLLGWHSGVERLLTLRKRLNTSRIVQTPARAAFMALAGAASVLALYPDFDFGGLQALKDATEPLAHALAFAGLTAAGAQAWRLSVPLILGLASLAIALELGQYLAPGRDPYLDQVLASFAGVAMGALFAMSWRGAPKQ